jgi:hypothetical protein
MLAGFPRIKFRSNRLSPVRKILLGKISVLLSHKLLHAADNKKQKNYHSSQNILEDFVYYLLIIVGKYISIVIFSLFAHKGGHEERMSIDMCMYKLQIVTLSIWNRQLDCYYYYCIFYDGHSQVLWCCPRIINKQWFLVS